MDFCCISTFFPRALLRFLYKPGNRGLATEVDDSVRVEIYSDIHAYHTISHIVSYVTSD